MILKHPFTIRVAKFLVTYPLFLSFFFFTTLPFKGLKKLWPSPLLHPTSATANFWQLLNDVVNRKITRSSSTSVEKVLFIIWPRNFLKPGAHQMELPSPLISWVNLFPSRVINRSIFFCNALELMRLLPAAISLFSLALSSISARNLLREPFYL